MLVASHGIQTLKIQKCRLNIDCSFNFIRRFATFLKWGLRYILQF